MNKEQQERMITALIVGHRDFACPVSGYLLGCTDSLVLLWTKDGEDGVSGPYSIIGMSEDKGYTYEKTIQKFHDTAQHAMDTGVVDSFQVLDGSKLF